MDINNSYNIALYDRLSNASINPHIQSSDRAKMLYQKYQESKENHVIQTTVDVSDMDLGSTIKLNAPFLFGDTVSADSVEISKTGLKLFNASNLPAAPTDDPDFTAWCAQQFGPNLSPVVTMPSTLGDFGGNRGNVSNLQPVNFYQLGTNGLHNSATQDDYINAGVIDQDYVTQFNAILKDSQGDLRLGDNVLEDALNKYAELKGSILNSDLPDTDLKMQQLENSLNWAVGTSLNRFGFDMTQSNTMLVKASAYSDTNKVYDFMYGDGSIAKSDTFSYDNSSYKTAINIVMSAAKLIEKGVNYINNNQYDPQSSTDVTNLLSAMNSGTGKDSSNLSLSSLNNVISTFKSFENAMDSYILNNAGKAAQSAPTDDIASVYTNMRYLTENYRLGAHVDEEF